MMGNGMMVFEEGLILKNKNYTRAKTKGCIPKRRIVMEVNENPNLDFAFAHL